MNVFVSKQPVPVTDGDRTIFIKPKMDFGTRNAVVGEATKILFGEKQGKKAKAADTLTAFDIGAYNVALLVHNVVGWSGPDFDGVECNEVSLRALNPDLPLLKMVLDKIGELNPNKGGTGDDGGVIEGKSALVGQPN